LHCPGCDLAYTAGYGGNVAWAEHGSICHQVPNQIFYWDISLLAVPTFILISLYLFVGKLSEAGDYWKKRFLRLIQVYVFWVGIQYILYLLLGGRLPLPLKMIFRNGGPDLTFGSFMPPMPSIFYFLYVLIVCTVLTWVFFQLPEKIKRPVAALVVLTFCFYFIRSSLNGTGIDTRSMKGYYIYVPLAYYLYACHDTFVKCRFFLFGGYLISILFEWHFNGMVSAYGRMSVLLGALTVVSFFVAGRHHANRPVTLLARYSMGIFALHPYALAVVKIFYALLNRQREVFLPSSVSQGILLFLATFILTCLGVWGLAGTPLRRYVS